MKASIRKEKVFIFFIYACVFSLCRCPEKRAQQANASLRAAFVHVVGDLLQSVSVMISAIIIYFKVSHRHLIPDVYGSAGPRSPPPGRVEKCSAFLHNEGKLNQRYVVQSPKKKEQTGNQMNPVPIFGQ